MKQRKYNHLCKVPNTDEGRAFVAKLRKYMKDTSSAHKIKVRGRNPIVGAKAYNGGADGGIRLAEAKNMALYLTYDKSPYQEGFNQAKEWYHKQGVERGYERGYNEGWNDAKEYIMNQVREIAKNEQ
jgi:flagellar biosynthesis/type III secretory pathway protein FliH